MLNAGAKEGSARKLGGELYRYGFDVLATRNYAKKNPTFGASFIAINPALAGAEKPDAARIKRAEDTAAFLSSTLKINIAPVPDAEGFGDEGADIAIVLGEDFQYNLLQDRL